MEATTLFVVAVTTAKMIMPGMPAAMSKVPGMQDMSAPSKTLTMTLTSSKKADAKSKAECAVPEGLKIGPKAILNIDLPQKSEGRVETSGEGERGKTPEFTLKYYWMSSQTVPPGQPKIISSKSMDAGMKQAMAKDTKARAAFQKAIDYDEGSHAYWPGEKAKSIVKDSTCPGNYELVTNYCGGTSITFDKPQDFLAPIDLTSPAKKVDLTKFIKVEWKPIPNAAAYIVNAFGGKDSLMVVWTSASAPDLTLDVTSKALSNEQLEKYIKNGTLLPADKTFVNIPIGIFQEVGNAMVTVTAVGVDKLQVKDGIETQVIVRSNATSMLGGAMGFEGGDEETNEGRSVEEKNPSDGQSGDVVDKADGTVTKADNAEDKAVDKKDQVKDVVNKAKGLFKKRW